MILFYIVVFGVVTSLRHYNFQTQTWDLAAFVQSIWSAAHGGGLVNTLEQVPNHLGLHFSPFLFLLAPFYRIFESPYLLLVIQTIGLALGALPLYFLAKRHLPSFWPLFISGAYLLYPGLHWANIYDFHEITFFIPLLLAALYFFELEKWLWGGIFLTLAASVKEDAILAVIFVGLYLLAKRSEISRRRFNANQKAGIFIAVIALVYFIAVVQVFMPALGGGVLRFDRYTNLGETPAEIIKNIAADPLLLPATIFTGEKIRYLFWLFLPLTFLPFLSWRPLILLIPGLAENLLTDYQFQFSGLYHYDSILIPGIFLAVIYGVKFFLTRWPEKEKFLKYAFLTTMAIGFLFRSPINPVYFPAHYFQSTPQETAYRNMVKIVPPDVSVAAQTNMVPHLANREKIYLAGLEPEIADIVLLDAKDLFGFKEESVFKEYLDGYMLSDQYRFQMFDDRYIILLNKKFKLSSSD